MADDLKINVNGREVSSARAGHAAALRAHERAAAARSGLVRGLAECGSLLGARRRVETRACVTRRHVAGKIVTTLEVCRALRPAEGPRPGAGAASVARSLHGRAGPALRLLYNGHDREGRRAAGAESRPTDAQIRAHMNATSVAAARTRAS